MPNWQKPSLGRPLGVQVAEIQAAQAALASPAGQAQLRQYATLSSQLQKTWDQIYKDEQRAQLEQKYGRIGLKVRELNRGLQDVGRTGTRVFATLSGGLTVAAGAASPALFQQLTGSIQLFAGSIGEMLVPTVMELSAWLQRAADWIDSWDPKVKRVVAGLALWGIAGAGAVRVVASIVSMAGTATTAVVSLAGAIGKASVALWGFAAAHPVIAGLTAVTVAVGALTSGFGLLRDNAGSALASLEGLRNQQEQAERGREHGEPIGRQAYEQVPANIRAELERRGTASERQQYLRGQIRQAERAEASFRRNEGEAQLVEEILSGRRGNFPEAMSRSRNPAANRREALIAGGVSPETAGSLYERGLLSASFLQTRLSPEQIRAAGASVRTPGQEQTTLLAQLRQIFLHPMELPTRQAERDRPPALFTGFQSRQFADARSLRDTIQQEAVRDMGQQRLLERQVRVLEQQFQWFQERFGPQAAGGVQTSLPGDLWDLITGTVGGWFGQQ
jgi:hypothetical protein